MKKADLLKLAGQYFISDAGLSTANLIRKIQIAEGHIDCYATGKTQCEQMACRWRGSCLGEVNDDADNADELDDARRTDRVNTLNDTDDVDDAREEAGLRRPLQRSRS